MVDGAWYAEAVNRLAELGVVLGYEDGFEIWVQSNEENGAPVENGSPDGYESPDENGLPEENGVPGE